MADGTLVGTAEAARILGVDPSSIRREPESGAVPSPPRARWKGPSIA